MAGQPRLRFFSVRTRKSKAVAFTLAALVGGALFAGTIGVGAAEATPPVTLDVHLTSATGVVVTGADPLVEEIVGGTPTESDQTDLTPVAGKSGTYTATGLEPGTYTLFLGASKIAGTSMQWLGGAASDEDAQTVTLHGGTNQLDVSYASSGTISGTVTNSSGHAVAGVSVDLYNFNGTTWVPEYTTLGSYGTTSSSGKYSFNPGAAGSYELKFTDSSGTYVQQYSGGATTLDDAKSFFLAKGASTTVNAKLASAGKISGKIESAAGDPLSYIILDAYRLTGNPTDGFTSATLADPDYTWVATDDNGDFSFAGLAPGYYSLGYSDGGNDYPNGFIGGSTALTATPYLVTAGKSTPAGTVELADNVSGPSDNFEVSVSDGSGPIDLGSSAQVILNSDSSNVGYFMYEPGAAGTYQTYVPIPDGDYTLTIAPFDGSDGYVYEPYVDRNIVVSSESTSAAAVVAPYTPLAFTDTPTVDTDAPMVGAAITASPGTTNISSSDVSPSYQWYRTTSDGTLVRIRNAVSATYTPGSGDVGSTLSVRVTQTNDIEVQGHPVFSESTSYVAGAGAAVVVGTVQPQNLVTPHVLPAADAPVGTTLTMSPGSWDIPGVQFRYQWLNDDGPIIGANSSTHVVTAADETDGAGLVYGDVQAYKPGYEDSGWVLADNRVTVLAAAAPTLKVKPKLTSASVSGHSGERKYTITSGTWSGSGLTYDYSWYVDGASQGTGRTFSAYTGSAITVTVTAHEAGHNDGTSTTLASRGTHPGLGGQVMNITTAPNSVVPALQLNPVGVTLEAQVIGVLPNGSNPAPTYVWQRLTGKTWSSISGAKHQDYTIGASDVGHQLRAIITTASPDYVTSVLTVTAGEGENNGNLDNVGSAVIASTVHTGQKIGVVLSGLPAGTTHSYQWQSSTPADSPTWKSISKATSSTYVVAASLSGDNLRLVVTNKLAGSTTQVMDSNSSQVESAQIASLTAPTVTSAAEVIAGATLTATYGTWDPTPTSYTYQWTSTPTDGGSTVNIPGATGKTYKTTAAVAGTLVAVEVTAHRSGYPASDPATSSQSVYVNALTVHPALPTTQESLGDAQYGTVVTAPDPVDALGVTPDSWQDLGTVSYVWQLGGKAIKNATKSTYSPAIGDIGKALTVTETYKSQLWPTASVTSFPSFVEQGAQPSFTADVTLSAESLMPGVSANAAASAVPSGFAVTYQWQESATGSDSWTNISGATKHTFTAAAGNVNEYVRVAITEKRTGFISNTVDSDGNLVIPTDTISSITPPALHATPAVGSTESVNLGTWTVTGLTYGYQWYLDGVAIPGATGSTFAPTGYQVTQDLSVKVTATRAGYTTGSAISDALPIAFAAAPTVLTHSVITGKPTVCTTLSVSATKWNVTGVTTTYQWFVNGSEVSDAATYSPTIDDIGQTVSVHVTSHATGYNTTSYVTAATAAVGTTNCETAP